MRWWRVIWTDGLRGFARPWLLLTEMWGRQPSCLLRERTVLVTNDGGLHFVPQTGGNAARALIQNGAEEGEKTA